MLRSDYDVNEGATMAHLIGVCAEINFEHVVPAGTVQTMSYHESIRHDRLEFEYSKFPGRQTNGVMLKSTNSPAERCYQRRAVLDQRFMSRRQLLEVLGRE